MIGYVFDDGGREEAGYKGSASDCVARAIAILTDTPYKQVYKHIADFNFNHGQSRSARNGVKVKDTPKLMTEFGLEKVKLGRGTRPTYTEAYNTYGNCIVKTTKHVCALVDGNLCDTFDGRSYWWDDGLTITERERKATSIWVMKE